MRFCPAIGGFLVAGMLAVTMSARVRAENVDPAVVGERIQRLTAAVESLELALASQKRQIDALANELYKVRDEMARQGDTLRQSSQRPWADDLKKLADAISEVDRKRAADGEQVVRVLSDLKKAVASATDTPKPSRATARSTASRGGDGDKAAEAPPEKALEYVLESGQRLSEVVSSFNEEAKRQGYKTLSVSQVMKFNNIKDDRRIRAGTKLLLPVIPAR